jgi:hypothetical protein
MKFFGQEINIIDSNFSPNGSVAGKLMASDTDLDMFFQGLGFGILLTVVILTPIFLIVHNKRIGKGGLFLSNKEDSTTVTPINYMPMVNMTPINDTPMTNLTPINDTPMVNLP